MAIKSLEDFDNDYQAYANYLESAECANDMGYEIFGDEKGNVYEAIDGDWTKGHSHKNENAKNWPGRELEDEDSKNRPWKNNWLKYDDGIIISQSEIELIKSPELDNSKESGFCLMRRKK